MEYLRQRLVRQLQSHLDLGESGGKEPNCLQLAPSLCDAYCFLSLDVPDLQRELQLEQDRRSRCEESVEQLRLEMQMMGRLLAAAREQFVACGAPAAPPGVALRTAPAVNPSAPRTGRSKSDAKLVQQLQEELAASQRYCAQLMAQLQSQQQKIQLAAAAKKELIGIISEMSERFRD